MTIQDLLRSYLLEAFSVGEDHDQRGNIDLISTDYEQFNLEEFKVRFSSEQAYNSEIDALITNVFNNLQALIDQNWSFDYGLVRLDSNFFDIDRSVLFLDSGNLIFFDFSNGNDSLEKIFDQNLPEYILASLLQILKKNADKTVFPRDKVLLYRGYSEEFVVDHFKLHLIGESIPFKTEKIYSPHVGGLKLNIQNTEDISQFRNIYNIYSSFLKRDELTQRFLALYHILENFMTKKMIVELQNNIEPAKLTIRNLHELVGERNYESESLSKFLKDCLSLPHSTYLAGLLTKLSSNQNLITLPKEICSKKIEDKLNSINQKKLPLSVVNLYTKFENKVCVFDAAVISELIYKVRCGIVHNKEIGYHIHSNDLSAFESELITELIYIQQQIILSLLFNKNKIAWYNNNSIALF